MLLVGVGGGCRAFHPFRSNSGLEVEFRRWEQGGRDALAHGRLEQARNYLQRAMELAPEDSRIRERYAEICMEQGRFDDAIEVLNEAIERSEDDTGLRVKLGRCYLENGNWIPAVRQAEMALKSDRQSAEPWILRGDTRWVKGDLAAALSDYQRALSLDPGLTEVQLRVAQLQRRLNRPFRALSCVEQLLSRYPVDQQPEEALLLEGELLIDLGQPLTAIDKMSIAAARHSASPEVLVLLARAQIAAGQNEAARRTLDLAVSRFPQSERVRQAFATLDQPVEKRIAWGRQ